MLKDFQNYLSDLKDTLNRSGIILDLPLSSFEENELSYQELFIYSELMGVYLEINGLLNKMGGGTYINNIDETTSFKSYWISEFHKEYNEIKQIDKLYFPQDVAVSPIGKEVINREDLPVKESKTPLEFIQGDVSIIPLPSNIPEVVKKEEKEVKPFIDDVIPLNNPRPLGDKKVNIFTPLLDRYAGSKSIDVDFIDEYLKLSESTSPKDDIAEQTEEKSVQEPETNLEIDNRGIEGLLDSYKGKSVDIDFIDAYLSNVPKELSDLPQEDTLSDENLDTGGTSEYDSDNVSLDYVDGDDGSVDLDYDEDDGVDLDYDEDDGVDYSHSDIEYDEDLDDGTDDYDEDLDYDTEEYFGEDGLNLNIAEEDVQIFTTMLEYAEENNITDGFYLKDVEKVVSLLDGDDYDDSDEDIISSDYSDDEQTTFNDDDTTYSQEEESWGTPSNSSFGSPSFGTEHNFGTETVQSENYTLRPKISKSIVESEGFIKGFLSLEKKLKGRNSKDVKNKRK